MPSLIPPLASPTDAAAPRAVEAIPIPSPTRQSNPAEIFALFRAITEHSRPVNIQPRALQATPPSAEQLAQGGAAEAQAIADSATAIARAAAALGTDESKDFAVAKVLWDENLKQIARVQDLYNLGRLPFQSPPAS